jgi:hypothetical protein
MGSLNEFWCFLSHIPLFLSSIYALFLGEYFSFVIQLLVVISSEYYHVCYGKLFDPLHPTFGYLCTLNEKNVKISVLLDMFFANVASTDLLFELLPHSGHDIKNKRYLNMLSALVIVLIGGFFGFYSDPSLTNDGSMYYVVGSCALYLLIFILYFTVYTRNLHFDEKIPLLLQYYRKRFSVALLIVALIFGVSGFLTWTILQNLFPDKWFVVHPIWHLSVGVFAILLNFSKK